MDGDSSAGLDPALAWLNEHCKPYFGALFADNYSAAGSALKRASTALNRSPLPTPLRKAAHDKLRYLEYHLYRSTASPELASGMLKDLLREFSRATNAPAVSAMRKSLVLQLKVIAERDDGAEYASRDFHADLAALPPELRSHEVDYHVAIWAYRHDDAALLEQVLSQFTVKPGRQYGEFIWQHVNLMHQMQKGTATTRDVEEIVRRVVHPRMWRSVEATVWPGCVKRGLVDGKTAGMLAQKLSGFDLKYPGLKLP